jgi:hypothetical protein
MYETETERAVHEQEMGEYRRTVHALQLRLAARKAELEVCDCSL